MDHPGQRESSSLYSVQGIALVVHQKGKEARTILRYPSTPLESPDDISEDQSATNGAQEEDLFFRMDPRQMAKLFRPKPTLCGQPMTLSAGGTIFCCRAVLLEEDRDSENNEEKSHDEGDGMEHVELFSIIVALVPRGGEMTMSITGGWFEEERNLKGILGSSSQKGSSSSNKANVAFLSVIRVHLSLARLCAVLEREEHRCQYLTLQSLLILNIRKSLKALESTPNPSSPASISSKPPRPGGPLMDQSAGQSKMKDSDASVENFDREQEILETVMAAASPVDPIRNIEHKGNLARELVQFYHNLAQNTEDDMSDISLRVLGGEGVLYVNGHIAVAVEGIILREGIRRDGFSHVRPYQTLLFPYISRKDLLESLSTASSTVPRRLQQLLLSANALKSLSEIAKDSNLPQQAAVQIASYLVGQGVAVPSPVISPRSLLACSGIQQIEDAALPFSYVFGPDVDIFNLVAFLTTAETLGNAIMSVVSSEEPQARILRTMLRRSITSTKNSRGVTLLRPVSVGLSLDGGEELSEMEQAVELEEMLYKMVVWLCGRGVIVQLMEYLIEPALSGNSNEINLPSDEAPEKKVEDGNDDMLLQELRNAGCLNGSISLNAIAWRLDIDVKRLRAFAEENRSSVRLIARLPSSGDDWV